MKKITLICVTLMCNAHLYQTTLIYHENSRITFRPEYPAEYFGYSTLLTPEGLLVGAPKAKDNPSSSINRGTVFKCPLNDLDIKYVNCSGFGKNGGSGRNFLARFTSADFNRDDMWFGANIAYLPPGRLLINAPRWTMPYKRSHLLMNGASYFSSQRYSTASYFLREGNRQAFLTDGARKEYGEYGTHLNFYAYAQAGFSMAVTKINTILLGAPGLLQWTGGVVPVGFRPNATSMILSRRPIANPYYTKDLGPDEYFGYSVDSGLFEKNGSVLYVSGAPRYNIGSGKVLIFEPPTLEFEALKIKAIVTGPQSGAYFGASICCMDINGDGLDDLLVGAPTYVKSDGGLPYDQGAVFVYITKEMNTSFILEESGHVSGSTTNGAWFGLSIADLGDIDGDDFKDVAIGAPWENEGKGAVYIYKGHANGLKTDYAQRIQPEGVAGFGWSISKGFDVDENYCNDLAIGAHNSQTTYLYRCIPTMTVQAKINVLDAINLPQNTTKFQASFCASSLSSVHQAFLQIQLKAKVTIDPIYNRARLSGDSEINLRIGPGSIDCDYGTIEVNPTADLSRPISLKLSLEEIEVMNDKTEVFVRNAARLSERSTMETSLLIQLVRDCGEDMICNPWLVMTLEALDNPYIPGSNTRLGARLTILNQEEPAYAAKVNITLPMAPKRIPSECSLQDLIMSCNVPSPLLRGEDIVWEIELDYNMEHHMESSEDATLIFKAQLSDSLYRDITDDTEKELVIDITPEANFSISGKTMPNATIAVLRNYLNAGANVSFKHYLEITNLGPSNCPDLVVEIIVPEKINISANISGCERVNNSEAVVNNTETKYRCKWSVPAKVSFPVTVPLHIDLSKEGDFLQNNITYNATTIIIVYMKTNTTQFQMTTTLILEPEGITWKLILLCVILGLLLLAGLVRILHKCGFFKRKKYQMQDKDRELDPLQESEASSPPCSENDYPPDSDEE